MAAFGLPRIGGSRSGSVWLATIGLLGVVAAGSVAGPPIAAMQMRAALIRSLGAESVQADVVVWPPPALWWGRVDVLNVAARHLRLGTLDVEALDATFDHLRFDPGALYIRHELVVQALGSGVAHTTVTQDALTQVLAARSEIRDASVSLHPGQVIMTATVSVLGALVPARAEGHLALRGTTGVDLVIDRLTVAGLSLPQAFINQVTGGMNPILDARSLPFSMRFASVRVDEGTVTVDAVADGAAAR